MFVKILLFVILLILPSFIVNLDSVSHVDARFPNGSHKSPSGDCEKVSDNKGKPRCPNGYDRSPNGNCEKADDNNNYDKGDKDFTGNNKVKDTGIKNNDDNVDSLYKKDGITPRPINTQPTDNSHKNVSNECLGNAHCFTGTVTKVVDGDTVDIDNVRIRLALVNTPEQGKPGYQEATEFTKVKCSVGTKALVDEDDLQTRGSYGRMIGLVYCGGDNQVLINQLLLEGGYAKIFERYCRNSEFSTQTWAVAYGCRQAG